MNPRPASPVRRDARGCARAGADRRRRAISRTLGLACVAAAFPGCHGNQQAHRDLYFRELRLQEDEIYRLEDCIAEYQRIIRGYRCEVAELKEKLSQQPSEDAAAGRAAPGMDRSILDTRDDAGATTPFETPREGPPSVDVPDIDLGEPADPDDYRTLPPIDVPSVDEGGAPSGAPEGGVPPMREETPDFGPTELPPPLQGTEPLGEAPPFEPAPGSISGTAPIAEIDIAGYAGPPVPAGEATLIALLRPTDQAGAPTRFHGEASLMLRDPSARPDGEKIARWDFTSSEVAESWRDDAQTPVLDLAVVLPDGAPRDRKLELWVRVVDQFGDKTLAMQELTLGRLASIDQAPLAEITPPQSGDAEVTASDRQAGSWRMATRPAATLAGARPADSGWRRSDAAAHDAAPSQVDRAVAPAAFAGADNARPLASPPSEQRAADEWSPNR